MHERASLQQIFLPPAVSLQFCGGGNIAFFLLCWLNRENSFSDFGDISLVANTDGAVCELVPLIYEKVYVAPSINILGIS